MFADGVEDIGNRISVDVCVVDCLLAGFIEDLVGYFSVGKERISHGVWDGACDKSFFFVNMWHHDSFI